MPRSRASLVSLVLVAACAVEVAGCSSSHTEPPAPSSAGTTTTSTTLLGSYVSMPGAGGAVTRLSFSSDGTYVQANYPCDATVGNCIERGTFTISASLDTLNLTAADGTMNALPLSVLDRADDDANDGDDGDDAGSATTTTKGLVTTSGDGGADGTTSGDDDAGGVSLVQAGGALPNIQQFTLKSIGGTKLFTHESPVENQLQTENCWIYSTMGWADALANYATPSKSHVYSEAYIYYWEIYEQLTNTGVTLVSGHGALNQGGFWGRATWLASRYGMMVKGTFSSATEEIDSMYATTYINASLKSGKLKTIAARNNHALVRQELDAAFGLSSAMTNTLNAVFGSAVTKNFSTGASRATSSPIFRPVDVVAELSTGYRALSVGRLSSAIGTPDYSGNDANKGTYAWSGVDYPHVAGRDVYTTRFATERRIIAALNDGFPVPISWYADGDSYRPDGTFQQGSDQSKTKGTSWTADGGYHESLIADYEVDNVPGFGTLLAGSARTQAQKDAAMSEGTTVRFFRIKNSWGTGSAQQSKEGGYNDLYMTFLDGTVHVCDSKAPKDPSKCANLNALQDVDLPPGY